MRKYGLRFGGSKETMQKWNYRIHNAFLFGSRIDTIFNHSSREESVANCNLEGTFIVA